MPVAAPSAPITVTAPDDPPPTTPAPAVPVLIEVYGDDSMYGASPPFYAPNPQSEPADTQALLRDQLGSSVTVISKAEGGTASTLVNMMNGVDGGGPPFAERIKSSKAQIVLDSHAVNDDLSQSLAPYSDALVAWVLAVRAVGKIPVLEEPNPVCDNNHPYLANYVSVMDNVAAQYQVPIVKQYEALQAIPNLCSHYAAGIFPDNAIYQIKAQREAAVLAPLVKTIIGGQS